MPESAPGGGLPTVVIATLGTQGDVRPLIALGLGLQRRGHRVRMLTSANFAGMIGEHGLEFHPLTGDFQALLEGDRGIAEQGLDMRAMARIFRERMSDWSRDWVEQARAACDGAGLLLASGSASLLAAAIGEAQRIPVVYTQLQPLTPSRHLPPLVLSGRRLPGALSLAAYQVLRLATWQVMRDAINQHVRPRLGLAPYPWYGPYFSRPADMRVLYGFSTQVLPRPADWPAQVRICGYWQLQPEWTPPADLQAFLDTGPPPVYIGFGSMTSRDAAAFTGLVGEAVRLAGVRAVLASGWGGLQRNADDDARILHLQHAPHSWLFPRMAAAVHHGGAGTTGAAAAAGIPSVVIPFYGDQPFWAQCLSEQGVAPPALRREGLDAATLAEALREAGDPRMRARAHALGERIRAEDGIATAIAQLVDWKLLSASAVTVNVHIDAAAA